MLAFLLRRAMGALPTLFGVSLVVFLLTTLLPEPGAFTAPAPAEATKAEVTAERLRVDAMRRARFLDIPRFFNSEPHDVRSRVEACIVHIVVEDDDALLCEKRLAQMGGAGLPFILPQFDDLPAFARGQIAVALVPVARRMGFEHAQNLEDPSRAERFWRRFWEDRSVDFSAAAARREIDRLIERDSDVREKDLRKLDTFALEPLIEAMRKPHTRAALMRITRLASLVADRSSLVAANDDAQDVRTVVSDWQAWWYVYESDYVVLQGGSKIAASIAQTRYAKWVLGAATGQLGLSARDGKPVFDTLLARAKVTLGMVFLALFASFLMAVPLGALTAWWHGHAIDKGVVFVLLALHAQPTFVVALLLERFFGRAFDTGFALPVFALATVSFSVMTQQQRGSMMDTLRLDYVRTARAKGARSFRIAARHALRNAMVPTVMLAGLQLQALLGAAFVVEEVFGIRGLGWETLRAIESHDTAWLIVVTLTCACFTLSASVASDALHGLLDPRVREKQRLWSRSA